MKELPPLPVAGAVALYLCSEKCLAEQLCGFFLADAFFEHIGGGTAVGQKTFHIDTCLFPLGRLEEYYIKATDFDVIDKITNKLLKV